MTFRLLTTVWGREFADLFLQVTVRSLLSEGNAGAFAGRHAAVYSIYTTEDTAVHLQRSPLFQQLRERIDTQFVFLHSGDFDRDLASSHWIGWRKGVNLAKQNGEIAFFIIADMLYPRNTLERWMGLFEEGYRAIWTSTVQVVQETALSEIDSRFPPLSTAPISMSSHEVIDLAVRHLHPKFVCMFRDSGHASRHPEVIVAAVPGEGLAERAIGSHAFCVDPNFFDLSDALSPLNRFEAIAFENPTGVGFEPLMKQPDLYLRRTPLTEDRLSNMGSWLNYFLTPTDVIESRRTYRFALHAGAHDAAFRRVRDTLGFFACQVRLTGAIYRVTRELQLAGCTLAAQLTATAHYAGRLRRHWRVKGAVTAFVPTDAAIEQWGLRHFNTLLIAGNEKLLRGAIFAHLCEGTREFSIGDSLMAVSDAERTLASGTPLHGVQLATIVGGPVQRDDCTIYFVNRVLLPSPAAASESRSSLLPNRWDAHAARLFSDTETPPPPSSQAPPSPPQATVEVEARPVPAAMTRRAHSLARTVYRVVRGLPGFARPADWLKSTILTAISRIQRHRERAIGERIAATAAGHVPTATSPAASRAATRNVPSSEIAELFRDVQRARAVLTLVEVLRFYRSKVRDIVTDLPALTMVEACVRDARITEQALVATLRDILDKAPDFAEAWHELGDLHFAKGEYAEAISCFDQCVTSRQAFHTHARISSYALAAASKAAALEASGLPDAAAETYRQAMEVAGQSGTVHVDYARLLRRLGRFREAAREFDIGMESDLTVCDFPSVPRDFADLSARLAASLTRSTAETTELAAS